MKFSIITAVYNNKAFLEECINSVINQSYDNIEYIIIDGGSTDGSRDIIKKHEHKISKWISERDSGIYDAINKGVKLATGDVIGLLHSDDIFANKNIIEKAAELFKKENADLLYSDLEYVDKQNNTFRKWHSGAFNTLRFGWMPPHPTLFIRKNLFDRYGFYNTKYRISSDYEMVLRLFNKNNFVVSYLPEVAVKMRTGGASNKSLSNIFQKSKEDYWALKSNNLSFPLFTLFCKNMRKIGQFF